MTKYFRNSVLVLLFSVVIPVASLSAVEIDASSIELTNENGEVVTLGDFAGSPHLVFFGYTFCPDVCPLSLYYVATALKELGPLAENLPVVFISVDPVRDTPEVLTSYTDAFHPAMIGMTGSYEQISRAAEAFRTTFGFHVTEDGRERPLSAEEYQALSADDNYVPYHSSQIYLMGESGELLDIIGYGSKPDEIAARIEENIAG